jgi:AcrR family transcriptional regulator
MLIPKFAFDIDNALRIKHRGVAMSKGKPEPAANIYPAHRERQRNRILDAAGKLFAERGIDRVTMGELTVASGLQPSTMYQYFSKKDDIVWAILAKIKTKVSARPGHADMSGKSGLSKITALLEYMADELSNQQAQVRFMAEFDAAYARNWPVERLLTLEAQTSGMGCDVFRELIREGIADGSLRSDLDPELTMQAVVNAAIGTQRRLASLDKKIELEYGQPIDRLFRETIRVLLLGLRATSNSQTAGPSNRARLRKVVPRGKT